MAEKQKCHACAASSPQQSTGERDDKRPTMATKLYRNCKLVLLVRREITLFVWEGHKTLSCLLARH